jgi:hypothetical protein
LVNVISLGISTAVAPAVHAKLGRDGAFLAPSPESRAEAFERIARRVDEHPDRAYLLAYCSGATMGNHEVAIRVAGRDNESVAKCTFDANQFGTDVCDIEFFQTACQQIDCGSIFACGACLDDECCAAGTCSAPTANDSCDGQDELCSPSGAVCVRQEGNTNPPVFHCESGNGLGGECGDATKRCVGTDTYCDEIEISPTETRMQCVAATLQEGDLCQDERGEPLDPRQCVTQSCRRRNSLQQYFCDAPARVPQDCSSGDGRAVCESGAVCEGTCKVRGPVGLYRCDNGRQCASGRCNLQTHLCASTGVCHYTWQDKLDF